MNVSDTEVAKRIAAARARYFDEAAIELDRQRRGLAAGIKPQELDGQKN